MQCPNCASTNLKVIDSRPAENNTSIRRRRECLDCGARFTTFERIERTPLLVVKRNGTREEFSHEKVLRGLIRSAEKRPVSADQLEQLANDVESELRSRSQNEVPASEIGELLMAALPDIDEVAYIRYASVYRQFEDPTVFLREIERLRGRNDQGEGDTKPEKSNQDHVED
ncbi:transcriptional regulator NrdR [Aerococcus urinaeequi]|uniref:transcriptional regulator NrdR n=1 Tax=Aerococcus urinaeequi TaxID=51665 RepID=UPI003AB0B992